MNTKLNKLDFLILAIYFVVDFIIQGQEYYQRDALLREYLLDFPAELIATCTTIYLLAFWVTPKFVHHKKYFIFTITGILIMVISSGIEFTIGLWSGNNYDWNKYPKGFDFILKMLNRSVRDVSFPFALILTKKFYEGQTQLAESKKQQKENELKLLRSQIDPHFLFNNLNTLDSLIDSDAEKAKEYINRLSLIYRYLIQTKDAEVMELSKELQFVENYIFLINTRFGSDYEFTIEKNTSISDKFIPTGAIQVLLENVVKHNKSEDKTPIKTTVQINDGWLIVTNTKSNTASSEDSFGTGLENLKARYKLLSDQQIQIHDMDKKFEVFIPIITLSE
jgi:two-component system LytT family sensor kinase